MNNRDSLGEEIKRIMEEETFSMTLSQTTLNNISKSRKKTVKERINEFLNMEIEIPIAPVFVTLAVMLVIAIIPVDIFKLQSERTIDVGGSQVIIRESHEVSKK
jgi:hypothetical protein